MKHTLTWICIISLLAAWAPAQEPAPKKKRITIDMKGSNTDD